jgi:hypothetical protein
MAEKEKKSKLNIELPEEVASGIYSNLAVITHSPTEFVTDFIQIMPGVPKAKVRSRIIMTPQHAKRLLKALAENDTSLNMVLSLKSKAQTRIFLWFSVDLKERPSF